MRRLVPCAGPALLSSLLLSSRASAVQMSASGRASRLIDSHVHVWSDGKAPFEYVTPPPPLLETTARTEVLVEAARASGVDGILIVQPANHKFDHSYVAEALKAHPGLFRGMLLANPTLPAAEATAELERLHALGFVGVRFNPGLFPDGKMDNEVGRALYARAGELGMPVGVMTFGGLRPHLECIRRLLNSSPSTKLVLDHFGFFRQPALGGLLGDAASNDEEAWAELLNLAAYPQVHVKVSALFRVSAEAPPHLDLQPRVAALVDAFGASRLMFGTDFPFVTLGGNGPEPTAAAQTYAQAVATPSSWSVPGLSDEEYDELMGGTAARLFGF